MKQAIMAMLAVCAVFRDPSIGHESAHCGFDSIEQCKEMVNDLYRETDLMLEYPHVKGVCGNGSEGVKEVIQIKD